MPNIFTTHESLAAVKETLGDTDETIRQLRGDVEALSLAGVAGAITEIMDRLAAPRIMGCMRVPDLGYMAGEAHSQLSSAMGGSSQPAVGEALDAITAMGAQSPEIAGHEAAANDKKGKIIAALGAALEQITAYDQHVMLMDAGVDTAVEAQQSALTKIAEIQL